MAIVKKRDVLLGEIKGRIGPVVVTSVRNVKVLKAAPVHKVNKKKKKKAELPPQNLKLALISTFISGAKKLVNIGFNNKKNVNAAFQSAVKYNLAHAITGTKPNFEINYPKIVISQGNREMAWSSRIIAEKKDTVTISWEIPDTVKLREIGNDNAFILCYDVSSQRAVISDNCTSRSALSYTRKLTAGSSGHLIHAYIFFVSPDQKSVSRSDYVGSIVLP
ncbi:DUF6266 family protein [Pedobacter hartonius]|uniref:Uncharacterized protein n=1 Tax=Pedobacter hartonius TaxID=425514 RepID=A0A1H4G923_9SPHI|nr:DUF6266 family protein [Pedobacter hartonius]SEB05937.1 hypothetical protein SAMN05443550_109120 [Pedobacter hartonius]